MLTIEWFEGPRAALSDLFALADDSLAAVRAYRDLGRVLVARDGSLVIGHLQLIAGERSDEAEVKSVAVREDRQGAGVGRMLLERAAAVCREERRSNVPRRDRGGRYARAPLLSAARVPAASCRARRLHAGGRPSGDRRRRRSARDQA